MKKVRKTSFHPKDDKAIQAILGCINNDSIDFLDCFNIFINKRELIGKSLKDREN